MALTRLKNMRCVLVTLSLLAVLLTAPWTVPAADAGISRAHEAAKVMTIRGLEKAPCKSFTAGLPTHRKCHRTHTMAPANGRLRSDKDELMTLAVAVLRTASWRNEVTRDTGSFGRGRDSSLTARGRSHFWAVYAATARMHN